jgi:hypothetical protein
MIMRVWKVITDLTEEENEFVIDLFQEDDIQSIYEMDRNGEVYNWDEVVDGVMRPYFLCTEAVIDKLSEICYKYGIKFGPIDITEDFLMGLYEIPDSDFIRYREEHLTEDIVYKKIKKFGGSSLDDLDKYVLETNI